MKAVKINMAEAKTSKTVKAIITGVLINSVVIILITVVISLFLNLTGNLFEKVSQYIMLIPLIFGGYVGGFSSARINSSKGLIMGIITSTVVLIIMLIAGFALYNTDITYMILLKALCLILPSIAGGIKGVNKK